MRVPSRTTLLDPIEFGASNGKSSRNGGRAVACVDVGLASEAPSTVPPPRRFTKHVPTPKSLKKRRKRSKSSVSAVSSARSMALSASASLAALMPLPAEGSTLSSATFVVDKDDEDAESNNNNNSSFDSGNGNDVPLSDLGLELESGGAQDAPEINQQARMPGSASSASKTSLNGSLRSANTGSGDDDGVDGDNINVVIRVRPLNAREVKNDDENMLQFPGDGGIWIDEQKGENGKLKPFTFNVVFEPEATQADVLEHSGVKKLIDMAVDGFSTTVFCYGQTGSGKTHTLTGPPHLFQSRRLDPLHPDHGLVFRSIVHLFEELKRRSDDATFVIKASYLEIYNEKVIDLLNPGTKRSNLRVRWDRRSRAFVVDNLFSVDCDELDDLVAVLEEGLKNRAIGHHNMNDHSSRSHTILTVHIHSEEKAADGDSKGVYITRHGKINFVDLAGSEMTKKTKSEGKTLEEANNINKSLMVLGYCIAQLSSQKRNDRGVHIPYRDSNLTKLLADSLAGNGVTLMIACVSPAKSNQSESSNTLRYAARAKKIKTKPIVVMDPREALIVSLKREVNILQQENSHLRQLLELADSDSGVSFPQENSASLLAQMGMDPRGGSGQTQPLDGRDPRQQQQQQQQRSNSVDSSGGGGGGGSSSDSRPPSQRSHDTLRQVSSMLFIATPATTRRIDKSRLGELDSSTLVDLIKDYMGENQDLRKENQDLFSVRDMLLRDQELVCRENERLLKKLEDVTSVCCRSPIVPVRPTYSAELLSASMNGGSANGSANGAAGVGLPRSSGASGSAPDLSSSGSNEATPTHHGHHHHGHHHHSRASPVGSQTQVWTNPLNWQSDSCNNSTSTTPTPSAANCFSPEVNHHQHRHCRQGSSKAVENGRQTPHHHHRGLTPSHSTDNLAGVAAAAGVANGVGSASGNNHSKIPHRLPAKLNKELEKRKIGSSLTNINIADSIRDKSIQRRESRNGANGSGNGNGGGGRKGSGGGGADSGEDELFGAVANRKKPGHLRDDLAAAAEKYSSNSTLHSYADERESRRTRKERTKKFREKSRSKERARMGDASKY